MFIIFLLLQSIRSQKNRLCLISNKKSHFCLNLQYAFSSVSITIPGASASNMFDSLRVNYCTISLFFCYLCIPISEGFNST